MRDQVEIILRDYNPTYDNNYIYSTWCRYSYYSPNQPIKVSKEEWFKQKAEEIRSYLNPNTIKIACFRDNPFVIAGYIAHKGPEVVWLCVKKDYHNQGIEKLLENSIKEKTPNGQE